MNSLLMIAICSATLGANDGETYADAHQAAMKTGKPMLVMVSTEWCPACQEANERSSCRSTGSGRCSIAWPLPWSTRTRTAICRAS